MLEHQTDPISLGSIIAGVSFVVFGSLVLPIVIGLLMPGRKGRMRTRREVVHDDITIERVCELYALRLEHDQFDVDRSGAPRLITARRGSIRELLAEGEIVTHANKPTGVKIALTPEGKSVVVIAEAWLNDFVIRDTGEGQMMDLLLTRLTEADLNREPPPTLPSLSVSARNAFCCALLTCAAPWLVRAFSFTREPPPRAKGLLLGIIVSGVWLCFIGAKKALANIDEKPAEITGKGVAYSAMALGAVGGILCLAALLGKL